MKKTLPIILLCLSINILNSQANVYTSNKYGFSINFPDTVEFEEFDFFSHVFTSYELIGEDFIMYQVQVLDERPNLPLYFKTKEENKIFLFNFLKTLKQGYDNTYGLNKSIFQFKDKYYSLDYEFKGNWTLAWNLPVYNRGIIVLNNHRMTKVSIIYSQELHKSQIVNTKYKNFIDSFNIIE